MAVELGDPDADNSRFPVHLQDKGKSWQAWWTYSDRNAAKDFYRTRTYLKADGLFQIEEAAELLPKFTTARVTHLGTKETREFQSGDTKNIRRDRSVRKIQGGGSNSEENE